MNVHECTVTKQYKIIHCSSKLNTPKSTSVWLSNNLIFRKCLSLSKQRSHHHTLHECTEQLCMQGGVDASCIFLQVNNFTMN